MHWTTGKIERLTLDTFNRTDPESTRLALLRELYNAVSELGITIGYRCGQKIHDADDRGFTGTFGPVLALTYYLAGRYMVTLRLREKKEDDGHPDVYLSLISGDDCKTFGLHGCNGEHALLVPMANVARRALERHEWVLNPSTTVGLGLR